MEKLSLFYPVKPYYLGQGYGQNDACVINYKKFNQKIVGKNGGVCPVEFTELYPLLGMAGHTGLDLRAAHGTPVYAATDGIVEEIQTEEDRGLGVGIITEQVCDFGKWGIHNAKTRYWHLLSINVKKGDRVRVGSLLGFSDNTGLSAGDHLHFELKAVRYDSEGLVYNTYQSNTYFGALNPEPYWCGKYAEDIQKTLNNLLKFAESMRNTLLNFQKGRVG